MFGFQGTAIHERTKGRKEIQTCQRGMTIATANATSETTVSAPAAVFPPATADGVDQAYWSGLSSDADSPHRSPFEADDELEAVLEALVPS